MLKNKFLSLLLSVGIMLAVIILFAAASVMNISNPKDGNYAHYAIIFPMKTKFEEAFSNVIKSGGQPVRDGGFNFVMIAASKNPNFLEDIKKNNAILIFSPIILGGCTPNKKA